MGKRRRRKAKPRPKRAARQQATETPEPVDDRRSITAPVLTPEGVEPQVIVVIEPARLPSGDDLYFQSPFVVPVYLLKAKALRDRAEPMRAAAIATAVRLADGTLRPRKASEVHDALEDLALAVILAAAAIEAHANDMIGRLPDDAMVEIPTRLASGGTIPVMRNKAAMDWLPMTDKLSRAVPLLHGSASIKGTVAWQKYKRLFRIRNRLVHPRREAINDPLKPGPFGRLMLGEGSRAPEDAAAVIDALEPGWIPERVRPELGL
jgi:hypothetical protein